MTITTPETLPDELVEQYHQQGFVRIPGVLSRDEAAELADRCRSLLSRRENVSWDQEDGNVMDWVAEPEKHDDAVRHLALHPGITGIAERLAGRPLRMFKTEVIRKRSVRSARTPLHLDEPVFPFAGEPVTLTAWVALVDVPVERGCMGFVSGSHLLPDDALFTEQDGNPFMASPELRWQPIVNVPLRAGDCTFHSARTVHMAGTNTTEQDRLSVATVYMDAETTYRPSPLFYGNSVEGLEPGDPLDGERFPRVGRSA